MSYKKQLFSIIAFTLVSLGVAGFASATTIGDSISVSSTSTLATTTVAAGSNVQANGDVTVAGTTTLSGDIVLGDASSDTITITGRIATTTTGGGLTVSGELVASLDASVAGTSTLSGDVSIGDAAGDSIRIVGTPIISPTTTFSAGATVGGDLVASLDASVAGTTTLSGDVSLGDNAADNIKVTGTMGTTTIARLILKVDAASATNAASSTVPTSVSCDDAGDLGLLAFVDDTDTAGGWFWICEQTGGASWAWRNVGLIDTDR